MQSLAKFRFSKPGLIVIVVVAWLGLSILSWRFFSLRFPANDGYQADSNPVSDMLFQCRFEADGTGLHWAYEKGKLGGTSTSPLKWRRSGDTVFVSFSDQPEEPFVLNGWGVTLQSSPTSHLQNLTPIAADPFRALNP